MVGLRQTLRNLLRSMGACEASSPAASGDSSRKNAAERGVALLIDNLSQLQRAEYRRRGCFEVTGGDTGTRYRIRDGCQLNVEELDRRGRRVSGREIEIGVKHILASGALPPAFPAVRIDGELYWDGGILSNTPAEVGLHP